MLDHLNATDVIEFLLNESTGSSFSMALRDRIALDIDQGKRLDHAFHESMRSAAKHYVNLIMEDIRFKLRAEQEMKKLSARNVTTAEARITRVMLKISYEKICNALCSGDVSSYLKGAAKKKGLDDGPG